MSQTPIKFAYWVPNVSGGLVISKVPQRTSWDIDYNRKLAQIAEKAGFEYALSQIRFTAGYGAEYQHESVAISHALLAATDKLRVIAAILPGPWHPAVLAKQISTISHLTNGRIAVNIVSGWFRSEFTAIGEPWLEHDERYRRSEEFIDVLKGIWTQDNFTYKGDFYRFHDPREWEDAGFRDLFAAPGLKLAEWPEQAAGLFHGVTDQAFRPAGRPTRALAQPLRHDHRCRVRRGDGGQQCVQAADPGVAEPGALLGVAVDLDDRVVERSAVDRRIGADLDIVADQHPSDLRNLDPAFAVLGETEAVAADHRDGGRSGLLLVRHEGQP